MVRNIMKDPVFLSRKSADATLMDLPAAKDLEDTLAANSEACVGMAANMIGIAKRIIVFLNNGEYTTMFNPEIVKKAGKYETQEGCLSLSGVRTTERYRTITVKYQDRQFKPHTESFSGYTAQIIQHEIDHCSGKLI